MSSIVQFLRQPSTLIAAGFMLGAIVYWVTRSPELALAAVALVPGAINDNTAGILSKVEALEDAARQPRP